MELTEFRTATNQLRFSHSKVYSREEEQEEEEAHLRGEHSHGNPVANMMAYHRHQATTAAAATYVDPSSNRRPSRASPNGMHHQHVSFESHQSQHQWTPSRSVSSLSNSSCGSDSDTGGVTTMKSSAKSSPVGSDCSMNNGYFSQTDSAACSGRTIGGSYMGRETADRMQNRSCSSAPSPKELREVFKWVDDNNDGLICGADLQGFMSRVLAFEISEDEAEALLLFYGNGRTLHMGTRGAVVDFAGFLSLYQCLCGEPASPEEQSMMAAASQVFDETRVQSARWV